ncbi:zinc finger, RING/FYVE/PHD-type [Artemisia annua]|uniref:RING-type E3 ubiquitin transferase n=1 Tax=Artemisia annua TaxID=35608 RepID=A0A2U1KHE8_ARTAN|nr:zinc finger, RING/FYVE/PHD-type [Artemisia annua]
MATSMSFSYGFIEQDSRNFVLVNGRPGDRQPDVLIVMDSLLTGTPEKKVVMVNKSRKKIESVLRDVGPSFLTYHMELVANKEVISTARFISVSEPGILLDEKSYRKPCMRIAEFVLWYESLCRNGHFSMPKAIQCAIKISILSKEKEDAEDICEICDAEFREDELIGTLECKHSYHRKCITKRLMHKGECPTCKATFFLYKF